MTPEGEAALVHALAQVAKEMAKLTVALHVNAEAVTAASKVK